MASIRTFVGAEGGREHFIVVEADASLDLPAQIRSLAESYGAAQSSLGLAPTTAVFRRIFLSDVLNQASLVRESAIFDDSVAISIVQQRPLRGAKVALLAYHIESPEGLTKRRLSPRHLLVEKAGKRHLWSTRLCSGDAERSLSAESQTRSVFDELIHTLGQQGASLRDHCLRTWIYMKDVDIFYRGMVDSRRALFAEQGLTGATHFIASTGIEGACAHRYDVVAMDAYSNVDVEPKQVSYLNDFDKLCATKDYNVTFERATRVAYADRAHIFISGTASIDTAGEVVHLGDTGRQLDRALENVEALLSAGSASLADMTHLIVYLRDPSDLALVEGRLRERFAELPLIVVQGAVCRPEWLVEVEGVAIAKNNDATMPRF
ncbi:MAG: Rid family hydrolase [Roseiarcus sp.]|jgi:enamine deaminase RidA (YjgF/YER057c/UK114 family)